MNEKIDTKDLADLSTLDEKPGIAAPGTEQTPEAALQAGAEFFDRIIGLVASVGLPQDKVKEAQKEYEELSTWLGLGRYYSQVIGRPGQIDPKTGALVMSILFIAIVILGREDLRTLIADKISGKKEQKKPEPGKPDITERSSGPDVRPRTEEKKEKKGVESEKVSPETEL